MMVCVRLLVLASIVVFLIIGVYLIKFFLNFLDFFLLQKLKSLFH